MLSALESVSPYWPLAVTDCHANDVLCVAEPATSEIKTLSRASPDAELQASANSGPLEAMELVQDLPSATKS